MENTLIYALHGFLGLPSDWDEWKKLYNINKSHFIPVNLWTHPTLNSSLSLNQWIECFLEEVQTHNKNGFDVEIWGYSMGGRLALSALTQAPHFFKKAVILSSNPGIENEDERTERLKRDLIWAEKFLTMEWNKLMMEWNNQPIFQVKDSNGNLFIPPVRKEIEFDRLKLSQALDHWSISRQNNLWPKLNTLNIPITWHVGELDTHYVSIAKRVGKIISNLKLIIHSNANHRLLM